MNIYQKAIKVRKTCENRGLCKNENCCPYFQDCCSSEILKITFVDFFDLTTIAKDIKKEKWNVK